MAKENKERIQKATAELVAGYLKTPQGKQGASVSKIAEFKLEARKKLKLNHQD